LVTRSGMPTEQAATASLAQLLAGRTKRL
jgi:hypothetical protein